jgi:hypothetical protein
MTKHSQKFTRNTRKKELYEEIKDLLEMVRTSPMFREYTQYNEEFHFIGDMWRQYKKKLLRKTLFKHSTTEDFQNIYNKMLSSFYPFIPEIKESPLPVISMDREYRLMTLKRVRYLPREEWIELVKLGHYEKEFEEFL